MVTIDKINHLDLHVFFSRSYYVCVFFFSLLFSMRFEPAYNGGVKKVLFKFNILLLCLRK